jgi:hypothetical protein
LVFFLDSKEFRLCEVSHKRGLEIVLGFHSTGDKYYMSEENSTGSNTVWAIALIIIVAIIAGVVYYSGVLKTGNKKTEIDINVTTPAAPSR